MNIHSDLSKISQINDHLYLSGIFPLDENYELIRKHNIKYILSCMDRAQVSEIHNKIMVDNPDLTIMYLPYNDEINQNLWNANKSQVNIVRYTCSIQEYDKLTKLINFYNNKPMIEVGYHFINNAINSEKNILVHCMAGVSRSVSLVTYYLMKRYHISFDKAAEYIKQKRSVANPNDSFKNQLLMYQNKRDQFTETDAKKIITTIKK